MPIRMEFNLGQVRRHMSRRSLLRDAEHARGAIVGAADHAKDTVMDAAVDAQLEIEGTLDHIGLGFLDQRRFKCSNADEALSKLPEVIRSSDAIYGVRLEVFVRVIQTRAFREACHKAWNQSKRAVVAGGKPWIFLLSLRWKGSDGGFHHGLAQAFKGKMEPHPWYTVINPNNDSEIYPSSGMTNPHDHGEWKEWYAAHLALSWVIAASHRGFLVKIMLGTDPDGENMKWETQTTHDIGIWESTWDTSQGAERAEQHYRFWADKISNHGWSWCDDCHLR